MAIPTEVTRAKNDAFMPIHVVISAPLKTYIVSRKLSVLVSSQFFLQFHNSIPQVVLLLAQPADEAGQLSVLPQQLLGQRARRGPRGQHQLQLQGGKKAQHKTETLLERMTITS